MYTRTRGCRLVILALALTALCGTHADECVIDQDEEFNRTVCPQGWFETGSKNCLLFYNERLNQSAARAVCHKQDANLVRLYDDTMTREHHEYVLQRMNYTTEVWVALTYNSDSGNSTWPGETNQGTFFVGRRRSKAGHSCTTLVMTQGFLNAQLCDGVEYNYTCEIVKPAGGCPLGWHPLGDLKWCLYGDIKVASYTNASATCEAFNGTVITFKDYQKFMILNAFFRRVWLDASDEGNPSRFYWSNGALLGELVTEERHTHLVENCLSVDVNSYTRNDDYCSLEIPFACQKESEMGEGYPVMEINPRFITVEPDFFYGRLWKNVFFEGDDITVTCRALRLPNGTVGWTFKSSFSIGRKYIKFTRFNNMDNWVVNSVGTILLDDTCVNQTVSTFSTPALKNITFGFPSCYSKIQETYSMCPPGGEPLMFCDTTFEFNIIDRPLKGPEFRLEFSSRSHILVAGEWLVAHCQVYPVQANPRCG
ncbi:hypothetical protein EGW08_021293 [Elysia chlorotica]|uniref:C-type lectin domain-containing protein n=1 Tax=Elysia chlorotica TaxID=188477 RepID=A0A433SP07_ELYCH|nr:hypothetical protein EGW08_021293 [Elysia chlorotica]